MVTLSPLVSAAGLVEAAAAWRLPADTTSEALIAANALVSSHLGRSHPWPNRLNTARRVIVALREAEALARLQKWAARNKAA